MRPDNRNNDELDATRREGRIEPVPPGGYDEEYVEPEVYDDRYTNPLLTRQHNRRLARVTRLIYWIFGVLETLIGIRAVLKLLAANDNNRFATLIYSITAPFVAPFATLFDEPQLGGSQIEFSSLVAIIVYALLAYALARLVSLFLD